MTGVKRERGRHPWGLSLCLKDARPWRTAYTSFNGAYTVPVKRLQLYIEEDVDAALGVEAARRGTSKAALIREAVKDHFGRERASEPLDNLVGAYDEEPGSIDDVVYGR